MEMNFTEIQSWASTRETDYDLAEAILSISTDWRAASQIWDSPTSGQFQRIADLLEPGVYCWGCETLTVYDDGSYS